MSIEDGVVSRERLIQVLSMFAENKSCEDIEFSGLILGSDDLAEDSLSSLRGDAVSFAGLFHNQVSETELESILIAGFVDDRVPFTTNQLVEHIGRLRIGRLAIDADYSYFGEKRDTAKDLHGGAEEVRSMVVEQCIQYVLPSAFVIDWLFEIPESDAVVVSTLHYPSLVSPRIALQYLQTQASGMRFES